MVLIWGQPLLVSFIVIGITGNFISRVASNVFYNVTCASNTMVVMMNIGDTKPSPLVYLQNLKGYPGCDPEIRKTFLLFKLSLNDSANCGVTKMLNKQTGYTIFYHRIVIEVPNKDLQLLLVQCVIPGDFNMNFVRLDWQKESLPVHNYSSLNITNSGYSWKSSQSHTVPYLQMSVRDRGTRLDTSTLVRPGSQLDLLIYLVKNSAETYGLSLRYLTLTDESRNQEEIIVMNGCSVDPYVIQVFPEENGVLRSQFRAFRLQSSEFVIFLATVNICLNRCVEVECYGQADSNGRRKREIPRYLPHYKNEVYEVEISAFLRLKSGVEGEIVFEDNTNETLDALYDDTADYSYVEASNCSNSRKPVLTLLLLLWILAKRSYS